MTAMLELAQKYWVRYKMQNSGIEEKTAEVSHHVLSVFSVPKDVLENFVNAYSDVKKSRRGWLLGFLQVVASAIGSLVVAAFGLVSKAATSITSLFFHAAATVARAVMMHPVVAGILSVAAVAGYGVYRWMSKDHNGVPVGFPDSEAPVAAQGDFSKALQKNRAIVEATIEASDKIGIDPSLMLGVLRAESSYGQFTKNEKSSASGAFQIIHSTWNTYYDRFNKLYGIPKNDPNDPESSAIFSAAYMKHVLMPEIEKVKKQPNATDYYLLYVFGPAGGAQIIKNFEENPDRAAAPIHGENTYGWAQIRANPTYFYNKDGSYKTYRELYNTARSRTTFSQAEKLALKDNYSVSVPDGYEFDATGEIAQSMPSFFDSPMFSEDFAKPEFLYVNLPSGNMVRLENK